MLDWLRRRRRAHALRRRAIPQGLWEHTLAQYPFLQWRSAQDLTALRETTALFLDAKEFTGAHGLRVDDAMAVAVAAQACVPVLHLGLACYDGFVGVVLHADAVVAPREFMDEDGVVHAYEEELSGEAMAGGPVMLSWSDVQAGSAAHAPAYNVVIHEFAHVLDMQDGPANGVPRLRDRATRAHWQRTWALAYDQFCERPDDAFDGVLDPYAEESIEEFFAVATEAFFVSPIRMTREWPVLYAQLRNLYGQDPASHCPV